MTGGGGADAAVGRAVRAYVQDALTLALENRPADPLAFLAAYFRAIVRGSTLLERACRCVHLAPPTVPAFRDNLVAAYALLAGNGALASEQYNSLVDALCDEAVEGCGAGHMFQGSSRITFVCVCVCAYMSSSRAHSCFCYCSCALLWRAPLPRADLQALELRAALCTRPRLS